MNQKTAENLALTIFSFILIGVMLLFLFTGCDKVTSEEESASNSYASQFVITQVDPLYNLYILYDRDTMVMYTYAKETNNRGTLTMLVNADGTPKLYEEAKNDVSS